MANRAPTEPDSRGFMERLRSQVFDKLDGTLRTANFVRGIVELRNFDQDKDEFARLLKKGISKVPVELVRDVNQWIRDGDVVIGDQLNLSVLRKIRTPILLIAGDLDWLGPHEDIFEEARQYRGQTEVRAVLLRRTSHIDLIAGERAGQIVGPLIGRFISDPSAVGHEDRHLVIAE
jgi:pimeloyl-ACP methyl ester carboxylesterase